MAQDTIKVELAHERSTKNTELYKTSDENAVLDTAYLKKAGLNGKVPAKITVNIALG